MKKLLIIFALAFSHFFNIYGQNDKLDQLFEKYQEVEGVTSIKIAKPMFGMLSSLDIDDSQLDQIKPLLSKITGLKVLIAEKRPADAKTAKEQKLTQINKDISSYLSSLKYSEIMTVNNSGAKIKFLSAEAKDGMLDDLLLIIDSGGRENILVKLDGKLSLDDVNKIINANETKSNLTTTTKSSFTSENTSSYLNGESRNVNEFSEIQVSTGVNVVFKQESPASVKVFADADKLQYVVTKVENGTLRIYVDSKGVKNLKFKNLSVNVSSPKMERLHMSSGASFTVINSIKEDNLMIDASSGSDIKGKFDISNSLKVAMNSGASIKADIDSRELVFKGTSGSSTKFEGHTNEGMFDVSSGAVCNAENLKTNTSDVVSTSGSDVSLNVKTKLRATASSGGSIKYKGNPEIDSNISKVSGGSLKPIN
ncbi:hypothetical protein HNP38_002987 [Chryseobacterium defluvii]|uniref:Putative auto-transporter adhesin head GIN domain-containing protein n=1 Tax=Chryseobacterium defluvii TaxID=160396 RepID=A0A840KE58_9FLAO|nr:DUF4252 domain-containing protein [Chryseobacterium defluvii]MBB4807681.1 hypothetical protein [Chryseobacterium defluvii]